MSLSLASTRAWLSSQVASVIFTRIQQRFPAHCVIEDGLFFLPKQGYLGPWQLQVDCGNDVAPLPTACPSSWMASSGEEVRGLLFPGSASFLKHRLFLLVRAAIWLQLALHVVEVCELL